MIKVLSRENSVFNHFLAEIRDKNIQQDSMRFRRNLERISEIFAYEISKHLSYEQKVVETPLGSSQTNLISEEIVIASLMRAALPMHQGFLNYFDHAGNCFISAYRKYSKDGSFRIKLEYLSCPSLRGKTVILTDAMLATGSSLELAYKSLLEKGKPAHTHIVSIVASKQGLGYIRKHLSMTNISMWLGAIDDELTSRSYIVPGLGDAGDLAYGNKTANEEEEEEEEDTSDSGHDTDAEHPYEE